MKITEKLMWNYESSDGLFETVYDPELDEDTRQREEDEAMENAPDED